MSVTQRSGEKATIRGGLKIIVLFLLATLLCVAGVEAFYYAVEKKLADVTPSGTSSNRPTPGAKTAAAENIPGAESAKSLPEVDIQAITRRDLFSSGTGTPVQQAPTDPLEGVSLSKLAIVLMGTVTGPDDQNRAIIYDKKERKQDLYQVGDFVSQAAIKEIFRGKVVITHNGVDEMLDIADARSVNVPQVRSVSVPETTSRRVIGRPVGSIAQESDPDTEADSGPDTGIDTETDSSPGSVDNPSNEPNVAPTPRNPRKVRTLRNGVIVKGRNTRTN